MSTRVFVLGEHHEHAVMWIRQNRSKYFIPDARVEPFPTGGPHHLRGMKHPKILVLDGAGHRRDFNQLMQQLQTCSVQLSWITE